MTVRNGRASRLYKFGYSHRGNAPGAEMVFNMSPSARLGRTIDDVAPIANAGTYGEEGRGYASTRRRKKRRGKRRRHRRG